MKKFTGFTAKTPERLMLDAGVFFKGYDISKSYAENKTKRLGATQGGGSLSIVPNVRQISADGVPENTMGMEDHNGWTVTLSTNLLETDAEHVRDAIGMASVDDVSGSPSGGYKHVKLDDSILDDHYIDNVAWIGTLRGSDKPVIVILHNALSLGGLSWTFTDRGEVVTPATFTAHYSAADLDAGNVPVDIYFPTME